MRDLTGEVLQLVHHCIDGFLKSGDLRVLFSCVDEYLFAEISLCDSSDNGANLSEDLLVGLVDLGILLDLALELLY